MKRLFPALLLMLNISAVSNAADFLSTEKPSELLTFGARIGVNTSNRTVKALSAYGYSSQGWGTGFDLGAVADINLRDYISIQPGVFFESRSNTYTFIYALPGNDADETHSVQAGTFNSYSLTMPVLANLHFNLTDDLRWNVEAGPYFALNLGSKIKNKVNLNTSFSEFFPDMTTEFNAKPTAYDFGIKFGTGIELFRRYTFNVDYLAGMRHAWKNNYIDYGGHTKAWCFTIGYQF